MKISFFGASGTVTGSRTLVEARGRVLVDCGLFQGLKKLRLKNWTPPPLKVEQLDAVVLTHAHIDHSGYLPALCKAGFSGPVYCTYATRDLLRILLPDAGYLQEEEARHANKFGWSKHRPALPLYTQADAVRSLRQLEPVEFGISFEAAPGLHATFSRAGHILGSACVRLEGGRASIAFSGDVGRPNDPIMRPPEPLPGADLLVLESTYGDRRHAQTNVVEELAEIVRSTVERGGTLVVPAFAVGRAQHLVYLLSTLRTAHQIPDVPIYLDSPMAIDATEVFYEHPDEHRLSVAERAAMQSVARYSNTPDQSRAIDADDAPKIVISASGMATGGRVLHHLVRFLPERQHTILLVGFQAAGTRGRSLLDGADELKIHGRYVPVKARIAQIEGLSAHADFAEMLDWLAASRLSPRRVFVNHGEPSASDAFRRRLEERFGWDVVLPEEGDSFSFPSK